MIQITTGKGKFGLVEVPEGATNAGWMMGCFTVDIPNGKGGIMHKWITEVDDYQTTMKKTECLEFLFLTHSATEEDAAKVVDEDEFFDIDDADINPDYESEQGFRNYKGDYASMFYTALESLPSLLKINNIDTACNLAVLQIK